MAKTTIFAILSIACAIIAVSTVSAETASPQEPLALTCSDSSFEILGSARVIAGTNHEYSLYSPSYTGSLDSAQFSLVREGRIVERKTGQKYLRSFSLWGTAELQVDFTTSEGCVVNVRKSIRSFTTGIAYLSLSWNATVIPDIRESLMGKWILVQNLDIPKTQTFWQTLTQTEFFYKNLGMLKESNVVMIQVDDPVGLIGLLAKMIRQDPSLSDLLRDKTVYVVTDQNRNLISKLLASRLHGTGLDEISLVATAVTPQLLLRLDDILAKEYSPPDIFKISYESSARILSLSHLVEFLLYQGVSLSFLWLLLTLSLAILVINFLKQVVGLYAFGIYAPVFLAVALQFLDVTLLSILIISAFLSTIIVHYVVKRVYLLHNAKHSLLITFYFIISMMLMYFGFAFKGLSLQSNLLDNIFSIFPFILIIFVVEKLFDEESAICTRETLSNVLQFGVIVGISHSIIHSTNIQYFLLSYTDVVFVMLLLNLAIGRYTGLQIFEYIRFEPILKSLKDEE